MDEIRLQFTDTSLHQVVTSLNNALKLHTDKDWNYSRISLSVRPLGDLDSPYLLWPETLDLHTKEGRAELKALSDEIKWGERHSSELGILETVSLRINKALLESTSDEFWQNKRPILRIVKKHLLAEQGVHVAPWYEVREVTGDDFDNR